MTQGMTTGRNGSAVLGRLMVASAALVAVAAGQALGGPLATAPRGVQPAWAGDATPIMVSPGAFSNRDTVTGGARSAAARPSDRAAIASIMNPLDGVAPAVNTPDWTLMPRRVVKDANGRSTIRRVNAPIALSALRGDAPTSSGSIFSAAYGPADAGVGAVGSNSLDDDGNPVFAAPTKYFQDFEDETVAREWRLSGLDRMEKFGRFAGPFRNSSQTLFVQCEPDTPYVVTFDLLFIAATLGDPGASDLFSVEVDGQPLLQDTFVVLKDRNQKFNGEREDFDADIYKQVAVTFTPKGDGVVKIKFKCDAAGLPGGETWGLDNVHIDIAPKQTLAELTHGDPQDFGASGTLGRFTLDANGQPVDTAQNWFRGDPNIRGPGPNGPTLPVPIPVPTPGAGVLLAGAGLVALRRRRPG